MPKKTSVNGADSGSKKNTKISFAAKREQKRQYEKKGITPFTFYWIKDLVRDFVGHKYFPDATATLVALASVAIAFPFVPPVLLIPLLIATFVVTMLHPLAGLIMLLLETLPMFMYQAPLLAWIFTIFVSIALFAGHKHYRTITILYALITLPLSYLGLFLELPAFALGVLFVGLKRGIAIAILTVLIVMMIGGLMQLPNIAPIVYNPNTLHSINGYSNAEALLQANKQAQSIAGFPAAFATAFWTLFSFKVSSQIFNGFYLAALVWVYNAPLLLIQIVVWTLVVFGISTYVIRSRSAYKGSESSVFIVLIPLTYAALSYTTSMQFNWTIVGSFIVTPLILFTMEYNSIEIVKALEVMKKDFLGKFGEAFEELTSGTSETLEDVANYEQTKEELREAILSPIEHREIAGAYNVKPTKGILLFGPPGTGKTLIMRALSNEIRARFFYVKTSQLISPYAGEAAQTLSKIFNTAKRHRPSVLFFDEIDSVAGSRELQSSDSSRQLLSTLLSEMDGFQKIEGIIIIGATNTPQILDPSIMRPGRFDKIIYMPLPDAKGREAIFRYYLKKLPISEDIDYDKLASLTGRFSGADIKVIVDEVGRRIADEALKRKHVLGITTADIIAIIRKTKPSTTLSQIAEYETFKLDYERRTMPEKMVEEEEGKIKLNDVVGLDEAKKALYEAVEIPILHPNLIRKYDVENIRGILLFGPPGTGKTMLMRALSNELGDVHLMTMSGIDIMKYGAENASMSIKQAFDRAKENAPSIIFIDEIDALVPIRDNATEKSAQITGEFLQQLDGIRGLSNIVVVAATNRPDVMDPALLRAGRFDKLIFIPPPNSDDREKLFVSYLSKAPCEDSIDYKKLADISEGYTGADIANVCKQAKMKALESALSNGKEVKVSMDDVTKLIDNMRPSAPGIVMGRYATFIAMYGKR